MSFEGHRSVSQLGGLGSTSWKTYVCGHCGTQVSGAVVANYKMMTSWQAVEWLLCTNCDRGSVSNGSYISPGVAFGPQIAGLPKEDDAAYGQARGSMAVGAYTGVELICRKILMHVAVEKGAEEGKTFASYITHLSKEGFVTPPMQPWVDVIRRHGNLAAHEIEEPDRARAESTLMFTAELLRLIYEMENYANKYAPPGSST